jgi:ABC-type branched-subunit amino acid transport system ATPase component/ABC-type branched-subunit amino acid transport system permease subunit
MADSLARFRHRLVGMEPRSGVERQWHRMPKGSRWAVTAAFVVFCYFLPTLDIPVVNTPGSEFAGVLFFPVGIYVLMAVGLNVVVGFTGLLDLGYVAFFAIGGYTMAILSTKAGWSFLEVVPVAIGLSMLAGVILGAPTLRLRGDYLAIVTLGFGEIIRITALNTESLGAAAGISSIPHPPDAGPVEFGIIDPKPYYWLTLTVIIAAVIMVRQLEHSRVGRAWTAIREDEDAAELMGVPTYRFKLWAFAIGAGIAGLGGTLFASKVSFISPDNYPLTLSFLFIAAVVLGGSGSTAGAIVGAILVAYLPERFRGFETYRVLVFGAALMVMMVFRPQGILPSRRRSAEMADTALPGGGAGGALGGEIGVDRDPDDEEPAGTAGDALAPDDRAASHSGEPAPSAIPLADPSPVPGPERGRGPAHGAEGAGDGLAGLGVPLLTLDGLTVRFGGVVALQDVSLTVEVGEIRGLIGPNGAGKTTVFNAITGVYRPAAGDIRLQGASIVGRQRYQLARSGVARTFQNIRLFAEMTALENVMVGADARHRTSVPGAVVHGPTHRREETEGRAKALELLALVGIGHRAAAVARNLPYGDQRRLEIARALATDPKLVLLDEPAAGFNPAEKRNLAALIRRIRDAGFTVLLIEHDMGLVMNVCDRIAVLDFGRLIADGPPAAVRQNERVVAAYLGTTDEGAD